MGKFRQCLTALSACDTIIIITRAVVGQRARLLGTFYIVTFLSLSHII